MMRSPKYMALFVAVCMSAIGAGGTPEIPSRIPGLPVFGSILNTLEREDPAMGAFLRDALASTDGEVLAMLRSDNPEVISLGIWVAHYHGRPDLLLQTPELLDDERRGLSDLSTEAQHGDLIVQSTPRVNSRYHRTIHFWIPGLPYEGQALRDALEAKPDPWANADTWSLRLARAYRHETPEEFDRIKREFLAQPESVVWFAVLDPRLSDGNRNVFTTAEVKTILSGLSPDIRRKIADRTAPLPEHYQRVLDSRVQGSLEEDLVRRRFDRYDALTRSP
jgi:hypothetical protein